jgi:hypothetical protein
MRDLNYDVDRALGIPARRPAALLSAAVDEALGQPIKWVQMTRDMEEIKARLARIEALLSQTVASVTQSVVTLAD